jgi:hypothetical protein
MPRHWTPRDPLYLPVLWADDLFHWVFGATRGTWLCELENRMWIDRFVRMKERERKR